MPSGRNLGLQLRRTTLKLVKTFRHLTGHRKTLYVWDRVAFYRDMWREAAQRHGLEFSPLSDDIWELSRDGRCISRINNCYVELDDPVTLHIAGDKAATFDLLERVGLPVAPHAVFTLDTLEGLEDFIARVGGPYVVKPASGTGSGLGVSTHLYSRRKCRDAAVLASLYDRRIIVEKFIPGEVFRFLFVGGEFVSAVCRRGIRVGGDGVSSFGELVGRELETRGIGGPGSLDSDIDLRATMLAQNLALADVPGAGEQVLVKSVADRYRDNLEVRTVYTDDVTRQVGRGLIADARLACETLRSDFCGVDLITTDASKPLRETGGVIGEINTTPGLHHHYSLSGSAGGDHVVDVVMALLIQRGERRGAIA